MSLPPLSLLNPRPETHQITKPPAASVAATSNYPPPQPKNSSANHVPLAKIPQGISPAHARENGNVNSEMGNPVADIASAQDPPQKSYSFS